jgi:hypothetical protein
MGTQAMGRILRVFAQLFVRRFMKTFTLGNLFPAAVPGLLVLMFALVAPPTMAFTTSQLTKYCDNPDKVGGP